MKLIKKPGKLLLCWFFEAQVKKLISRNDFKIVAVAGSVGKTSTKLAIAKLLSTQTRVMWQEGNYNDRLTVPLIFFNAPQPNLFDIPAWIKVYKNNQKVLRQNYAYDVVVVELGTDAPGHMQKFNYLKPDLLVLTAIAPEHMEYFGSLDNVADEELTAIEFSKQILINADDTDPKYYQKTDDIKTYGRKGDEYKLLAIDQLGLEGQKLELKFTQKSINLTTKYIGTQGAKIILAALSAADMLGLDVDKTAKAVPALDGFSGRMNPLKGINDSTIIDDSYNASPQAVAAALDSLYGLNAVQKIALLGNMNELGSTSKKEHKKAGRLCKNEQLDLVVTIGPDANEYLAAEAENNGCTVRRADSPYEAGEIIKKHIQPGAVVLIKGSQNGVFSEEAIKTLLANPADESKLVRQSPYWLKIKQEQFG